jgi:hypothetical protein
MMTRDEAKQIRQYIDEGGVLYEGLCKPGSYVIEQLQLDRLFDTEREVLHG